MFSCVSNETCISLYADDTKIWRRINLYSDHHLLQNDINNLYEWSIRNKIVFHPDKCKAISVTMQRNMLDNLPFNVFIYEINGTLIDYVSSQKDLGVYLNTKLTWNKQHDVLVANASSKFDILRRTCHFITDVRQKRTFYLTVVRSLLEHCSTIWDPQHVTHLAKYIAVQKRAIKWINNEPFAHYNDEKYHSELRKLEILPMKFKFIYNDLVMFYKIINKLTHAELPSYISLCQPNDTRYTRSTSAIHENIDLSTFRCEVVPTIDAFRHSYFYRTMHHWNKLPLSIRQSECLYYFKISLKNYFHSAHYGWPD